MTDTTQLERRGLHGKDERYFLKRNGYWFRPNAAGYTDDIIYAGHWPAEEAERFLSAEGVTAHASNEVRTMLANRLHEVEGMAASIRETLGILP